VKNVFIMTIMGEDKPYIIQSLAETTRRMGGEWLKSKVMHLEGHFTALMKVVIDADKEQALKDKLESLHSELTFIHSPAPTEEKEEMELVNLVVDCNDRSGLTHDIVEVLAELNLEAESLEVRRFPVTLVGGTVYSASLSVRIPHTMMRAELAKSLEEISDCTRITFE